MKRTILVSLSALTLSLLAAPAFAEEVAAVRKVNSSNIVEITPFNLVTRSYQGYFTNKGIPSNGAFLGAVRTGKVTAVDLVEKAIANRRLSPETINDRAYLNSVESHLNTLNND